MMQLVRQFHQVPEPLITAAGFVYKNSDNATTDQAILCFVNTEIWQINAADGTHLHCVNLSSYIKSAGIDPYANVIFRNNRMYLAGILDNIISEWNIKTGELLWHYRIHDTSKVGGRGIMIPATKDVFYVFDNRLYVLDSEQTLHVFERG